MVNPHLLVGLKNLKRNKMEDEAFGLIYVLETLLDFAGEDNATTIGISTTDAEKIITLLNQNKIKTITIDGVEYSLTPIEKHSKPIILEQTLKFEVYPQDLGESTWTYAKIMCNELDDGWRLPTKEELHIMYLNKNEIGVFAEACYWSSSEHTNHNGWGQSFFNGSQYSLRKHSSYYVRAVRSLSI